MDVRIQISLMLWIYTIWIAAKESACFPLTLANDEVDSSKIHLIPDDSMMPSAFACVSCSQMSDLNSLLEKHASHHDSDFPNLLAHEFNKCSSCGDLLFDASNAFSLLITKRDLIGEGSHRSLVSSLRFDIHSNGLSLLDANFCEAVIVETLPTGVFADSFELQHLVNRGVFRDCNVFGDKNLELPSALSNQSMLMLNLHVGPDSLPEPHNGLEIMSELPLHARYPPLDETGYSRVEINPPYVLMICKPKLSQNDCLSLVFIWTTNTVCAQNLEWKVPSGMEALSRIVSAVTLFSSLLSALIVVYTTAFCSSFMKDGTD